MKTLPQAAVRRWMLRLALALGALLGAGASQAQLCTVIALAPVFLGYQGLATDGQGSVTVTCTLALPPINYEINLGSSATTAGSQRRMQFGIGNYLNYNFFCDAGYTQPWFNGTGSCHVIGAFPLIRTHTVYGRIPANQSPAPGLYSDNIPVTVLY